MPQHLNGADPCDGAQYLGWERVRGQDAGKGRAYTVYEHCVPIGMTNDTHGESTCPHSVFTKLKKYSDATPVKVFMQSTRLA